MKKKVVVAGVFTILFVAVLYATIYPLTFQHSVAIHVPIFEVSPQFTNLENWKNWKSGFSDSAGEFSVSSYDKTQQAFLKGNNSYKITILNAATIIIERKINGKIKYEYLSAFSDSNGIVTRVLLTENLSVFSWIKNKIVNENEIQTDLNNLRLFMEDESKRYGYLIKIEPVADTLILTREMIAAPGKAKEAVHLLYQQLLSFLKVSNISSVRNYHYESIMPKDNGYTAVAVGIPVSKEAPKQKNYEFLKLPKQGRLLIGKYTGPYDGINNLFVAMDKYVMNNKLKKVAQHLEKHQNTEVADSNNVTVEIAYPIY